MFIVHDSKYSVVHSGNMTPEQIIYLEYRFDSEDFYKWKESIHLELFRVRALAHLVKAVPEPGRTAANKITNMYEAPWAGNDAPSGFERNIDWLEWAERERAARYCLQASVDRELINPYLGLWTAHEVYTAFLRAYEPTPGFEITRLNKLLRTPLSSSGPKAMAQHLISFRSTVASLNAQKQRLDASHYNDIPEFLQRIPTDAEAAMILFNSLPPKVQNIVYRDLKGDLGPLSKVERAFNTVIKHSRLGLNTSSAVKAAPAKGSSTKTPPAAGSSTKTPPAAGSSTRTPPATGSSTRTPPASGSSTQTPPATARTATPVTEAAPVRCSYCNTSRHTAEQCRQKAAGKPPYQQRKGKEVPQQYSGYVEVVPNDPHVVTSGIITAEQNNPPMHRTGLAIAQPDGTHVHRTGLAVAHEESPSDIRLPKAVGNAPSPPKTNEIVMVFCNIPENVVDDPRLLPRGTQPVSPPVAFRVNGSKNTITASRVGDFKFRGLQMGLDVYLADKPIGNLISAKKIRQLGWSIDYDNQLLTNDRDPSVMVLLEKLSDGRLVLRLKTK